MNAVSLEKYHINNTNILRNGSPAVLYEEALEHETGSVITNTGALAVQSGAKTGRSPGDKRVMDHPDSSEDIWWGDVNIKLDEHTFLVNRERAIDYLNVCDRLYVVDGYAGWDPEYRIKVRIICTRAYHALFMHNMLIRPSRQDLESFGEPDYVIFNAGRFPANRYTAAMTSTTSVDLSFEHKEMVILGTEYAGEMKKGIFTVLNYLLPKQGIMSMHCSANVGTAGDTALFFGLSGTGKTTLSADPRRRLIGDDEHGWTEKGIFNFEGGCYAKCINLSQAREPEIYNAIRFGTVLENVGYDATTRSINYEDDTITENTRAAYPIEYIPNAQIPCTSGHPNNIIFLTCDAFGVLPPVSKLTPEQAMYHFISGYTAKVAGTEMGITEPQASFSACFGAPFLVWHPSTYAELLAEKIRENDAHVWLVNTGWSGGGHGVGKRITLTNTRSIINAIHSGALADVDYKSDPVFGLNVPQTCPDVTGSILWPKNTWASSSDYDAKAAHLAHLFKENFKQFEEGTSKEIIGAGPV
ncbi:MAG: phosphoenolpyruvate carboxykinase (ATP) [Candidatus Latescibacteria bacterium]|jgi:phosphoenolpyruvate carboxykinase (ATP)|nr:phosphoenolpyruvate carboxykinase (ATP) [Candidatus Latescibacterota bacterium]